MAHRSRLGIVALLALGFAAVGGGSAGCGSDDSGSGGTGATGGGGPASGSASVTAGGGGNMCGPGMVDPNDPCEVCSGMVCMAEALACCEKPGCLELIDCVRKTGCSTTAPTDPGGCFTPNADGGCENEINAATPAVALGEATKLGDCARAKCQMECGLGTGGAGGGSGGAGGG